MVSKKLICISVLLCSSFLALAQSKSGYGIQSDSTESNYNNLDQMGGPKTTGAQLKADNMKKESFFRVESKLVNSWYDVKKKIKEKTGIQIGLNYTALFMRSSSVIDEDVNTATASSGIFDLSFGWNAVGRKSGKNKGTLFLKINSRHAYFSGETAPMFHGVSESGYHGLPAVGYHDYTTRILDFTWQQSLFNDRLGIVIGQFDPTNYYNFHGLMIPWTGFIGYGGSVSNTINWPNTGAGVIVGFKFTKQLYMLVGVNDAKGEVWDDGTFFFLGDHWREGRFFKAVELAYAPTIPERYYKKISLTYWHSDGLPATDGSLAPNGSGLAFSSHWWFADKYMPYFRFAFGNGNGGSVFAKKELQIGNAFLFKSHDVVGLSFSWIEPNVPHEKDQMSIEAFYKFQFSGHFAISPDVQLIINPTNNPNVDQLWYLGVRLRQTL